MLIRLFCVKFDAVTSVGPLVHLIDLSYFQEYCVERFWYLNNHDGLSI